MAIHFSRAMFSFAEPYLSKRLVFGGVCGGVAGSFVSTKSLIEKDNEYRLRYGNYATNAGDFFVEYGIYYPTAIISTALISGCVGAAVTGCLPLTIASLIYGASTNKFSSE